jgi:hypothetical protein
MLGDWFIYLSVIVLVGGVITITALNFGATLASPLVRFSALTAVALLVPLSADAGLRAWRSAWVWLPIDQPRGLARFVWAFVLAATFLACLAAAPLVLLAR